MTTSSGAVVKAQPWNDPTARPYVQVERITKSFGDFKAVDDVSLKIYKGEIFCLLGASGCGKTTLLRMLGGFETPTSGKIFIDGEDMSGVPPYERPVNMMFQSYALFPHMSVEQNVAFGLKQDRLPRAEIQQRVATMLDLVKMGEYAKRKPHQLSGGQRQRVAIARALANRPKLVLADEPTAALDKDSTHNVVRLFKDMTIEHGTAILMVTHDHRIIELADRLVHMVDGRIVSDIVLNDALRICEFLKGVEAFKNLTPNELTEVAERMARRQFMPGEVIIREGEIGEELFLISEGEVEVERAGHEVARLGAGDFFGELALMSGNPRNATVTATRPVDTYILGKDDFSSAIDASASFREQLRRVYFQRH
jgi:ABC-type sulfate/molybdate transport systems ATPase subunit